MVCIILVSYNEGQVTRDCIESIKRNVTLENEIIVVDNNSGEETVRLLERTEGIRLVRNHKNKGFPAACNDGLRIASGEYIWFLNNDTLVPKGSLERMIEVLDGDEKIGMVGPVTNRIHGPQQIPCAYEGNEEMEAFAGQIAEKNRGKTRRALRLVGFSMLLRKSVLDQIGGLDERMGIGTFEDDELCMRLLVNGYKLVVAEDAFIHHIGNVSFTAAGGYGNTKGDQNQITVSSSYGMTLPEEAMIEDKVLSCFTGRERAVLHVDCGAGALGLKMMEEGKYAAGLERDPRKGRVASAHYNIYLNYQEGKEIEFPSLPVLFDTVIFERQTEENTALAVLEAVKSFLSPSAQVILRIHRIVKADENAFVAYREIWEREGCRIERGLFRKDRLMEGLKAAGFSCSHSELTQQKGFFNRCSLSRYNESCGEEQAEELLGWLGVFCKNPC